MFKTIGFLSLTLLITGCRISSDGIRLTKNFYEIDPGKFYRSAQLTDDELREVIAAHRIKTVINLQGARPGFEWYDNEVSVTKEMRTELINVSMAKESIPSRASLVRLLDTYNRAQRPILVHCRSGADRAGEASAIYMMEYMGKNRDEALKMLDWKYLYVELFAPAKKYFVGIYEGNDWARKSYDHCDEKYRYADRRGCRRNQRQVAIGN